MSLITCLAPFYDPARRRPPVPPQQRRLQRVAVPRALASPLAARMPSHHANRVIKQIGVIGRESQGPAMELRNYLAWENIDTKVKIGWGYGSRSSARDAGFTEEDGTLGDIWETIRGSDLVWIPRSPDIPVLASDYATVFSVMKPHSILAVSDGVVGPGRMQTLAVDNQKNIIAVRVNPEEMGPFVRDLNIRARQINGAGTDSSLPVHQIPAFPGRTTMRNFGLFTLAFGAGALVTSGMDLAGGLPSMVQSVSAILHETNPLQILPWGAALGLWYYRGNLLKYSRILRGVYSAAVSAIDIPPSSKVEPAGAGCFTLPCDCARSGSCHPESGMPHFSVNIKGNQNNVNFY